MLVCQKKIDNIFITQYALHRSLKNRLQLLVSELRSLLKNVTLISLLNLTDTIHRGIELAFVTILLMFDFSKAFDTIDHTILLIRLYDLGFTHHTLLWFHDYLLYRQQAVIDSDGNSTEFITASSEVPQGSVIGPILFLIYMNSILDEIKFCYELFVDDLQIYIQW